MGTTLMGAVLFRMATNVVVTMMRDIRITANATKVLHDFGLPAIMPQGEMPDSLPAGINVFRRRKF